MKKIISILACVCLVLSAMMVPVFAAETSATITFDDKAKRTTFDSSAQQIWEENGITVTNNKGTYANALGDYANPARFYAGTETIIEYPSMTKIEVTAGSAKYAQVWADSNTDTNATVTVDGSVATIVLTTTVDSYTVSMSAQTRVASITVYAAAATGACTHEETTATSNGDETHAVVCNSCGETVSTADCQDIDLDGACDTCTGTVALPETLTITEAVALGAEQATGAYTADKYLVTGQITAIANTTYGNMYIADEDGNAIYIYGLYNEDGSIKYGEMDAKPDEGDTITVLSVVGNYSGTAQLKNAWLIEYTAGELEPTTPDPEADSTLTIEDAIALGESKQSNIYTENKYYVTGTVTEVYNEAYGNMYIADENGNTLTIYGTYSADGSTGYADMETKPVAGDTITVYGIIGQYNGTAQMKNGYITEIVPAEEETFEGTDPNAPIELAVNTTTPATLTEIKVPAAGTVFVEAADANGILHVTSTTGACTLINGMTNQVEISEAADLTLCGYEMVNIYNAGEETVTLYVFLEAGVGPATGTWDNPEVLEFMENPYMPSFPPSAEAQTELEAGNLGYFYKVTATEDCIFVINVSAVDAGWNNVGYQLSVTNNTTSWQSDFIVKASDADDYYDSLFVPVNAGDEILINAGTFDPADVWNAPAGTLNVRVNTTTVGASDYPEVLTETGTYSATVEAGSYGYNYEYTAEADGVVTVTMNDENWTYVVNNLTANQYGDTQWSDSDPVVSTTSVDVKAGDLISIMVNTYDPADSWNAPAGTVNWTLGFTEKAVSTGKITVSDAEAEIGKEFTVTIDISENPGIIAAKLLLNYDVDVLELVKVEAGDFANGSIELDGVVLPNYNFSENITDYPYVINWVDALATENITTNGTFVTLTFKVKDDATVGTTDVSVTFAEEDIFDVELNNVAFEATAGTVTIVEVTGMPGDANEDGEVNTRDAALVMQYSNGWNVTINLDNADVNGDGEVNTRDYALLMQHSNGWNVELQ